MDIKNQEIIDHMGQMQGPIPGQSLTADPDNPYPWEQPPKYTTLNSALHSLFDFMTEEETYMEIVAALGDGMPVGNLTETILQDGFQKGAWNPDLMIQLVEPTMYMVMSMAEKAGVKYRIDNEDSPDIEDADPQDELDMLTNLNKLARNNIERTPDPASNLPQEIQKEIETFEAPSSLLSPTETPELIEETNSLLARG
jgi:hypothetical protein